MPNCELCPRHRATPHEENNDNLVLVRKFQIQQIKSGIHGDIKTSSSGIIIIITFPVCSIPQENAPNCTRIKLSYLTFVNRNISYTSKYLRWRCQN